MTKTIAQIVTGTGRSAVATVRLRGNAAESLIEKYFWPKSKIAKLLIDRIYFGQWKWNQYEEDLVVVRTNQITYEIHCHGGQLAAHSIVESLSEAGAIVGDALQLIEESTMDRFSVEAIKQLPSAVTVRTAAILLDQSRGAMVRTLSKISQLVDQSQIEIARRTLEDIIQQSFLGSRISKSFEVVLMGPPNAGKSSLVNAMLGFDRAIVFDQPGTTRDTVEATTALDGWPITFVDTAGLRITSDAVETIGVEKAKKRFEQADLILQVFDLATGGNQDFFQDWNQQLTETMSLRIGTKIDLISNADSSLKETEDQYDLAVSSLTGTGICELNQMVVNRLIPNVPKSGEAIPISESQIDLLLSLQNLIASDDIFGFQQFVKQAITSLGTDEY